MKQFKCRASALGEIMGVKGLGKTGETYVKSWLKEQVYNRRVEISSKYLSKGLIMEDAGIDLYNEYAGIFSVKNEQFFENDFICGTPDIILKDEIIDIKCPYDFSTFPLFEKEIPNMDYYYQLQGYMWLTGRKSANLVYTLVDMPEHLIEREAKSKSFQLGYDFEEVLIDLSKKLTYSDISIDKKIKCFKIDYNEQIIDKIKTRVEECRNYINSLI
jgi:hypothetical protein